MTTTPSSGPAQRFVTDWSPSTYLKFEDERTRPARDLLAQVPLARVSKAVDVGCGPGNSTELIAERFPDADILGLDTSPAMLDEARKRLPRLRFERADANVWTPDADVGLVYANAAYQWIPRHLEQLPRVLRALRPGAVLAVQMPDNLTEPTHRLMREVAGAEPWAERLKDAARDPLPPPRAYYEALKPHAARLDIWHTIYNHRLADAAAIVEFVRGTGLRPFIDPLPDNERQAFLAAYTAKIAAAYPPLTDGSVLLRFPRLFLLAQR
ncbi:MAG TPA: trans-aconitate 2-methyltransferase [Caulobacteraceae bacterium]|jgi:trans-aconitate 2-methyltransferase|nr:trans-aconitate 2-methyltransferase [Caulobacteraceae bacterium]